MGSRSFFKRGFIFVLITVLSVFLAGIGNAATTPQAVAIVRVLNLIYDPIIESQGGKRVHEVYDWRDPIPMVELYNQEIHDRSGGFVNLEVIDTVVVDEYPPQWNGYVYTDENYYDRLRNGGWLNLMGMPEDGPNQAEALGNTVASVQHAQSFKALGSPLEKVLIGLSKIGNPNATITVALRSSLTGPDLRSKNHPTRGDPESRSAFSQLDRENTHRRVQQILRNGKRSHLHHRGEGFICRSQQLLSGQPPESIVIRRRPDVFDDIWDAFCRRRHGPQSDVWPWCGLCEGPERNSLHCPGSQKNYCRTRS